jgi:3-hydroxyacyl-[acyl-carrier-protein] dehydratase
MPGVMIIEALAQAAAILSFRTMNHRADDRVLYYFVGIDRARFKRPVLPGDALTLEASARAPRQKHLDIRQHGPGRRRLSRPKRQLMCTVRTVDDPRNGAQSA